MHTILVVGAGKIGTLIAFLLARTNDYHVYLADIKQTETHLALMRSHSSFQFVTLDATDETTLLDFIKQHAIQALVSSLPYYHNVHIAQVALRAGTHYFDLTEDIETTRQVKALSRDAETAFVSQCGLAPGWIGVLARHMMRDFTSINEVKVRVGALPVTISNALQYAFTWSVDGLINEYGNPCQVIKEGALTTVPPLEDCELIEIDGLTYETFNTSGGVGDLMESYQGKVQHLNYKTIRYPGHCQKMKFLMFDLKLNDDRDTLKRILMKAIPETEQDVVIVYVSVNGMRHQQFVEENRVNKFYAETIDGLAWSAIQLSTASEICTVIDMVFADAKKYRGFIHHQAFLYDDIVKNRFGKYFS